MEKIHHAHTKKAEKMGVTLELEPDYNRAVAFWPERNLRIFGADPRWALEQMAAAQKIMREHAEHTIHIEPDPAHPWNVFIHRNGQKLDGTMPPAMWAMEELMDHIPMDDDGVQAQVNAILAKAAEAFEEDPPHTKNGVPTNGREAHQKGFAIVDCPYLEDDDDAERWSNEWEDSAEEVTAPKEDPEPEKIGSVVKTKYRAIYAERGHPTHCGDELAVKLNNLVLDGSHTNLEYFKMILDANDIDMTKYNTTNNGWQGRYRMTGRNKLAKKVHSAGGVFKLPNGEQFQMSQEWMSAQRFK